MGCVPLALALLGLLAGCSAAPGDRIVGGATVASASSFPYQCAVYNVGSGTFLCGCSLISGSWVLTAASCLRALGPTSNTDLAPSSLQVLLGGVQLTRPARVAAISRALIHPSWTFSVPQDQRVNLAWMNLATAVPYTSVTLPVQLVTAAEAAVYAAPGAGPAVVAGWGSTGSGGFPATLQSATGSVLAGTTCDVALAGSTQLPLSASELCASAAPCAGDVGGALVVTLSSGARQVGIVSRTTAAPNQTCGEAGQYAIYTAVGPYRNFIQLYMNEPLYVSTPAAASVAGASLAMLLLVFFAQ